MNGWGAHCCVSTQRTQKSNTSKECIVTGPCMYVHFAVNSTGITLFKTLNFSSFTCPEQVSPKTCTGKPHEYSWGQTLGFFHYYFPLIFSENYSCFCKMNCSLCVLNSERLFLCPFDSHFWSQFWKYTYCQL